ncbi:hypothetical protein AX16_000524 [Volvariella volvacea WC 439]|nr:hypothetical protein AX16_000524 [Volvariella volvacea WC 439]
MMAEDKGLDRATVPGLAGLGDVPLTPPAQPDLGGPLLPRSELDILVPFSLQDDVTTIPTAIMDSGTPLHPTTRPSDPSTPLPHPTDLLAGPAALQQLNDMNRPLNVTDALTYLDSVKVQFSDKPEVYNHFLDIMKDFKSQVIDTPGVIQRVSRLFHGNNELIKGFNTFLPAGYRIETSQNPNDHSITVTTPLGTSIQHDYQSMRPPQLMGSLFPPSGSLYPSSSYPVGQPPPPLQDTSFSPGYQNPQTTAAASFLGNLGNKGSVEKQPAGEFNHAIQYLNKIKAWYADDPNIYKQFLDILQTYQKEQRHIQDVYAQVQNLFKDAPDLLAEFKAFLPDNSGQSNESFIPNRLDKNAKRQLQPQKRKKRVPEKEPTPVPPSKNKRAKQHHKPDSESPPFSPYMQHSPPLPPGLHGQMPPPQIPSLQHSQPVPQSNHAIIGPGGYVGGSGSAADKLLFFDRAKKALESRETYDEFLKFLSLYSREIIDTKTLVERAKAFLRDGDLLAEFKDLVGWDDRSENVENGPPGSIRTGPPEALSALPADDGEGPSYRRLPDNEIRLACSGRDELCRSVLNDEWVSHPTWASEEAGFLTHKKNSFEEALHKSEEERHEYHVHLEGLSRTIAILDPLNSRIEEMPSEERSNFKLKPDFGGSSKCLYHRTIKKIYGRDSGLEIIQALQDCPAVAVPVVLARLKQKDEEWRRAQREWSRTWREVDSKNFYKSLDHQGISFKANDKKNITAKYFVGDIESIKAVHKTEREKQGTPAFVHGLGEHQLEYAFHDTSVFMDSLKMVYSFLDRSQAQYSSQERRSVEKFLRAFIPVLCMYPAAEFNAACGPLEGMHDDDSGGHEANGGRRSVGSTHSNQSTSGVSANILRRKLMRTAQERAVVKERKVSGSVNGSRAVSPALDVRPTQASAAGDSMGIDEPKDIWIQHTVVTLTPDARAAGSEPERPFFANTTFYTLLRLIQLLYSRLLMCKEIGAQLAAQKHASLLANKVAVDLGLDDPHGPSAVLAQTIDALGDRGASEDANVVYMYLLNACEKLFDGDLDQPTFEEHMRWFFGNKAYHLFTLDRLITALVKQVQTILTDNKCQELWSLLQSAANSEIITNQDVVRYRREAERHVGLDDHLYRIQWIREKKSIRVHLIGTDEPSVETDHLPTGRWKEYVNTYVMTHPTEWLPVPKKESAPVFLRRTHRLTEGAIPPSMDLGTRIRINVPNYKILYESGTEDVMWRRWNKEEAVILEERARVREEERKRSRWLV